MGYPIPKTIINISLQEKDYYQYVDRLYLMIDDYNDVVHSCDDIQMKLLEKDINNLNKTLQPGIESLCLSSLGIDNYINDCKHAINQFRDVKRNVAKQSHMIEVL